MQNKDSNELGLTYKADIPLRWRAIEDMNSDPVSSNQRFFILYSALDDIEITDQAASNADLLRVEAKLDLVLELLAELYQQKNTSPETAHCELGATGMYWTTTSAPEVNQQILIELYLSPRVFIPLCIRAKIESSEKKQGLYLVKARFITMDDNLNNWMEKFIFRQHRRAIAQQN